MANGTRLKIRYDREVVPSIVYIIRLLQDIVRTNKDADMASLA
jgi:hypothetical protein